MNVPIHIKRYKANNMMRRYTPLIWMIALSIGVFFVFGDVVHAQVTSGELGAGEFGESGLAGGGSLTVIVARIIRGFIGLLGIVAVGFIVYGGWLWMTAGGDETKVDSAKKVIINGTIGMAVILASFAIASFVINSLVTGVTGQPGGGPSGGGPGPGGGPFGGGAEVTVQFPANTKAGFINEFSVYFFKDFGKPAIIDMASVVKGQTLTLYQVTDAGDEIIDFDVERQANTLVLRVKETDAFVCPENTKGLTHCFPNDGKFKAVLQGGGAIGSGIYDEEGDPLACTNTFPCTGTWSVGDIDDNTPPSGAIFSLTDVKGGVYYTNAAVPVDSNFTGKGDAIDDLEVKDASLFEDGSLFMKIPFQPGADGFYPAEADLSFPYDTQGFALLSSHDIDLDVRDTSNNEGTGSSLVYKVAAAHCFNKIQDEDEQGLNCGGSSCPACSPSQCTLPADQCDSSCTEDIDCDSGVCGENGQCVVSPIITGVFFNDGAPGNFIQIVGKGFGAYGPAARVMFENGNTSATAVFAQCPGAGASWTDAQIIVRVPDVAVGDYAITVVAQSGLSDSTDDTLLPLLPDFNVNNTVRPGIACVQPNGLSGSSLLVGSSITVHGTNFGALQEQGSKVTVGSVAVAPKPSNSWNNTSVQTIVPSVTQGMQSVVIERAGIDSNPYNVLVGTVDESTLPIIGSVHPSTASPGDMITIIGTGFGSQKSSVFFGDNQVLADTDFPEQCSAAATWSSSQIVVKIPENLPTGNQPIVVERLNPTVQSEPRSYVVEDGEPGPNLCAIKPNNGPAGTAVSLYGESFGLPGSVSFANTAASSQGIAWTDALITGARVPDSALSGDVVVSNTSGQSNPLQFTVNNCLQNGCLTANQVCCTAGTAVGACVPDGETCPGVSDTLTAAYEWIFATGKAPQIPRLLNQCGADLWPSPAPSDDRSGGNNVCVNSLITGEFSTRVSFIKYGSDIVVERCVSVSQEEADALNEDAQEGDVLVQPGSCALRELLDKKDISVGMASGYQKFVLVPSKDFVSGTTYHVTLSNSIVSDPEEGEPIHMPIDTSCPSVEGLEGQPSACFSFTTQQSNAQCDVSTVRVNPFTHSTDQFGLIMTTQDGESVPLEWRANGLGADECVFLNTQPDGWSWSSSGPNMTAALVTQLEGDLADRAHVTAVNGLAASERVQITATYSNPDGGVVSGSGDLSIVDENPYVLDGAPQCNVACSQAPVSVTFSAPIEMVSGIKGIQLHRCFDESCKTLAGQVNGYFAYTPTEIVTKANGQKLGSKIEFKKVPYQPLTPATWYKVLIKGGNSGVKSVSGLPLVRGNEGDNYTWKFRTRNEGEPCQVHSVEVVPIKGITKAAGETVAYTAVPLSASDACSESGQQLSAWDYNWQWVTDEPMSIAAVVDGGVDVGQTQPWCSPEGFKIGSVAHPAVCGDGVLNPQYEECDDGNSVSGDDCSANCLLEGVVSYFDIDGDGFAEGGTCGNAVPADPTYISANNNPGIEGLEECDDGNMEGGDGCSITCLNEGSSFGGSVCGNGDVGPGEDCDDGNLANGDGCSSICLIEGSPRFDESCATLTSFSPLSLQQKCEGNVIFAACGNGQIEMGEACDDGNAEGGDGCSSECLVEFGEAGPPEDDNENPNLCTPATDTDGFVDPVQRVVAIGLGSVDQNNEQTTKVRATVVQPGAPSITGVADFALQCGYTFGSNCAQYIGKQDSEYGVASNSCCVLRPSIVSQMPEGANACLNAQVYVDVDQKIDTASLVGNAHLYDSDCSADEPFITVALSQQDESVDSWYGQLWEALKDVSLAVVRPFAYAQDSQGGSEKTFCESEVGGSVQGQHLEDGGTRILYNINQLLDPGTDYMLVLDGGLDGVKASNGVVFAGEKVWLGEWFTTATTNEACELGSIALDKSTVALGDTNTSEPVFVQAFTDGGALLSPMPGVYNWEYEWTLTDQDPADSVIISGSQPSQRVLRPNKKIGSAVVLVEAEITENAVGEVGETFSDSADVDVFVCENRWPQLIHGFVDYDGLDTIDLRYNKVYTKEFGQDFSLGSLRTNFKTKYCRDRGTVGDTSDDLPALKPLVITSPPNPATTLKEFFFQPDVPGNKDVIGLRVEKNPSHLPLRAWYNGRGFTGNPTATNVGGYPALQDGRTLYISGVNASVTSDTGYITDLRTNVYVFSYNQGATADTLAIYQQLINNFELLVNTLDRGNVCYFDADNQGFIKQSERTEPSIAGSEGLISCVSDADCLGISAPQGFTARCGGIKSKIGRDLRRINGLSDISAGLEQYYGRIQSYPVLSTGTFVPGRSVSTWNSWQSSLGNNLGFALPVDPLNSLSCADEDAEGATCWNQTAQQYACAPGSFAYEYVTKQGGQSYELRSEFELPLSLWSDVDINEPKWRTANVCDGTVIGAAEVSVCGNNVLEGQEACDPPGITKNEKQPKGGGLIETITYVCTNSCVWQIQGSFTAAACGNGEIDEGEACDDGDKNGDYGFCNEDCQSASVCGDGTVQSVPFGPEVCEVNRCDKLSQHSCSTSSDCVLPIAVIAEQYGSDAESACTPTAVDGVYSCGPCVASGSKYGQNEQQSCNWDCRQSGPYCGDGVVQAAYEECDGTSGLPAAYEDASCPVGQVFQPACNNACQVSGGSCVTPLAPAGDVEPVLPTCGDGAIDPGEECDAGAQNAYSCVASYANPAQTCTYCHKDSCQIKAQTGGFCGDDVLNGSEACDTSKIKGGALEACLALGYDYGVPQCNVQCTGYTEQGCQYCGIVEGSGTFDVSGVFIRPGFLYPIDRVDDSWQSSIAYNGDEPQNALGSGYQNVNAAGAYGYYVDKATLPSGDAACTEYSVVLQQGPDASFETDTFVGDGQKLFFRHFVSHPSLYPQTTFLFVVEWPDAFEDLDLDFYGMWEGMQQGDQIVRVGDYYPLTEAPQPFKQMYSSFPEYCLGEVGLVSSPGAPVSCTREKDVFVSYLYDTKSSAVGYEVIAITNPSSGDDSILFNNKPSDYTINVIDVKKKGIMKQHASDIKLHIFTDGDKHLVFDQPSFVGNNKIRFDVHSDDSVNFFVD